MNTNTANADVAAVAIGRLVRRAQAAAFVGAGSDAAAMTAAALLGAVLVLRAFGVPLAPSAAWATFAILPLVAGAVRVRALRFGAADAAAWLDRAVAARGLLVTARERPPGPWGAELGARLQDPSVVLPRLQLRRPLSRLAVAAVFAVTLVLLPPLREAPAVQNPAIAAAVAELEATFEQAARERALDARDEAKLQAELAEVKAAVQRGERVGWHDVDALAARIAHAKGVHELLLQRSLAALAAAAAAGDANAGGALALAPADLLTTLHELREAGLLEQMPAELRRAVEEALQRAPGSVAAQQQQTGPTPLSGPDAAARGAEAAQRALALQVGEWLQRRAALQGTPAVPGPPGELALPGLPGGGLAPMPEGGTGAFGLEASGPPGQGGLSRGRGDATLEFGAPSTGDATKTLRLPRGLPSPDQGQKVGTTARAPEVAPVRSAAGGGAAPVAGGEPGAARVQLRPRHREVVRRFFDTTTEGR